MDDLDGYSCSDSGEDEVRFEEIRSEEEEELVGGCLLRIAFRGGNTAEAIEDEAENNRRVETLAREKAEEDEMLKCEPWPLEGLVDDVSQHIAALRCSSFFPSTHCYFLQLVFQPLISWS